MRLFAFFLALSPLSHAHLAAQLILQSSEDAVFLASLSAYEGRTVEGFSLDLDAMRLVTLGDESEPVLTSERKKLLLKNRGLAFWDVTDTPDLASYAARNAQQRHDFPPPNSTRVKPILTLISEEGPRANLAQLTNFETRYYLSESGKEASRWLLGRVEEYIASAPLHVRSQYSVEAFEHSWGQSSIIARISPFSLAARSSPVTIVSAHLDSINNNPFLPAPGADDDGSGTVTILEGLRVLIEAEYNPATPVEFHWYSAEEGGMLGSQAIVQAYAQAGMRVKAQHQFDMTAWLSPSHPENIGILTNDANPSLTAFVRLLVERYLSIPHASTTCFSPCSDHASWFAAGYPASSSVEGAAVASSPPPPPGRGGSQKHMHDEWDTADYPEFSFRHMAEFVKLAVGFVVELGGWEGE